jgi:hypothetical protein
MHLTRSTRSPIAISQGQLGDDHGLFARRVEQINRRPYAARPVHNQSVRFDVLQERGFGFRCRIAKSVFESARPQGCRGFKSPSGHRQVNCYGQDGG